MLIPVGSILRDSKAQAWKLWDLCGFISWGLKFKREKAASVSLHAIQNQNCWGVGDELKERAVTDLETVYHMNKNVERSFENEYNEGSDSIAEPKTFSIHDRSINSSEFLRAGGRDPVNK
jgi:hypothetical protein